MSNGKIDKPLWKKVAEPVVAIPFLIVGGAICFCGVIFGSALIALVHNTGRVVGLLLNWKSPKSSAAKSLKSFAETRVIPYIDTKYTHNGGWKWFSEWWIIFERIGRFTLPATLIAILQMQVVRGIFWGLFGSNTIN